MYKDADCVCNRMGAISFHIGRNSHAEENKWHKLNTAYIGFPVHGLFTNITIENIHSNA